MLVDYHTHTPLCRHAEGEPEAFIEAAISAKLAEYGISDHAPALPEPFDDWRMLKSELPDYHLWIEKARAHADHRIIVKSGLECDWIQGCEAWIEELSASHPWDYLIGSVHYLKDWDFDNPKWLGRWAETDLEATWARYWKEYVTMVNSGLFDIMGHPDLIKKFGFHPQGDLRRFYEPVIQAMVDQGVAFELNTAGWFKKCAEQYPAHPFLEMAAEAQIPVLISSDAHRPNEVARKFPEALQLVNEVGIQNTCRFTKRKQTLLPFNEISPF